MTTTSQSQCEYGKNIACGTYYLQQAFRENGVCCPPIGFDTMAAIIAEELDVGEYLHLIRELVARINVD